MMWLEIGLVFTSLQISILCVNGDKEWRYKCYPQVCEQLTLDATGDDNEMYSDTNGNCTFCQVQCDNDVNCLAIECGLTNCLGWKNGKCSDKQDMGIATRSALQTCIKTFDVTKTEGLCPSVNDTITPLPRKLSETAKSRFAKVKGPYIAEYDYPESVGIDPKYNAGSVRSYHPIPNTCDVYYFEMEVLNGGESNTMAIGLTTKNSKLKRLPGWDDFTVGYHSDDGNVYNGFTTGEEYGAAFSNGDVVGCGVDLESNTIFFTKNGRSNGVAITNIPTMPWYPTIGLHSKNEKVRVNFGEKPFKYDISKHSECKTNGGRMSNVACRFPFNFEKVAHHECISENDGSWCSTKVNKHGIHIGGGAGFWGYCGPGCRTSDASGIKKNQKATTKAFRHQIPVTSPAVINGNQSKTNKTDKAAPVNTAGGSIHYIMYIGIVFAILILTIVVVKVYQYKYKYRQFLEEGRPPEEYRRKKSRDYGSVSFKTLIYGQIDRIVPTKDVKSQAAFLPYDSKREIKRTSFAVLEEIGSGNFGSVARGELMGLYSPDSKTTVAIKTVNGSAATGNELMDLLQEIKLMSFVQPHLNLVSMIGSCKCDLEKSGDLWLLLEFCQYGDLKNYLAKNETKILRGGEDDPLNSRCLIKWAYDVCKGMEYLSENKIMHGDLAARNVLLDESPVLKGHSVGKVADFGMSKKFYENTNYQKESRVMVPWKWMAYEFLTKGFFTLASDVWSFQVVLWEIMSFGRIPYGHQEYSDVVPQIENGYRLPCPQDMKEVKTWSPLALYEELGKVCFVGDPDERATFSDVAKIIEKELSPKEKLNYERMTEEYLCSRISNYLSIGEH